MEMMYQPDTYHDYLMTCYVIEACRYVAIALDFIQYDTNTKPLVLQ